ncbi:hypothetical protein DACRYDRAFT_24046 [Dacryopinax primogenitus]|uniref:Copper transport protein n=1 Tax=Dacryopinax primogenitus (strain DJM 731) TaxID=1858805 RepID=M5FTY5_DACPD|nr:uncharacterized protein DACRYDRAFT_24046 [Dacryopinax primogenitus]EJT98934.1 hypothetical protein DACRYDRAFT_24046 [Dacryopinax primogenitus]
MDDMPDMDMPGMDSDTPTSTLGTMGMMLGFHATPFDQLWFLGWTPQTNGAMFGACIGLVILAVLERWVAAIRGLCEVWWKQRTDAILAAKYANLPSAPPPLPAEKKSEVDIEDCCPPPLAYSPLPPPFPRLASLHRLPPFLWSHDLPRGLLQVVQAALGYALMLAFMQYNWGYCLSILVGLGVGETMFGRFAMGGHSMTGA